MKCDICKTNIIEDSEGFVYCDHCGYSWMIGEPEDDVTAYDIVEDDQDD